ncbi:hypothetical protein G3M54_01225 [Bacillus megaterium NBRC 15308 = ATCC 14581]|nr:hypothetical protein [Priestia megaterium NBRC 15308 = ATCC 14581]
MAIEMSFDETEQFSVTLLIRIKLLLIYLRKWRKGQRTLDNVHHSSAVQPNTMIQVDPDSKDPIKMEVENENFVNKSSGNSIGQIEQNVSTAQTSADNAQSSADDAKATAVEAKDTAEFAVTGVLELDESQVQDRITQSLMQMGFGVPENVQPLSSLDLPLLIIMVQPIRLMSLDILMEVLSLTNQLVKILKSLQRQ